MANEIVSLLLTSPLCFPESLCRFFRESREAEREWLFCWPIFIQDHFSAIAASIPYLAPLLAALGIYCSWATGKIELNLLNFFLFSCSDTKTQLSSWGRDPLVIAKRGGSYRIQHFRKQCIPSFLQPNKVFKLTHFKTKSSHIKVSFKSDFFSASTFLILQCERGFANITVILALLVLR